MFNALRSDELLVGIGRVLRAAADVRGPLEDYERTQLLSALSVSRLLAAEQLAAAELMADTKRDLADAMQGDDRAEVERARIAVAAATTGPEVGGALMELLGALPREDATRARVRASLRAMVDHEVEALGRSPG